MFPIFNGSPSIQKGAARNDSGIPKGNETMATKTSKSLKYVLPEDGKGVNALIASAFRAEASAREKVQIALIGIAYHAWKHGDWTGINKLLDPDNGIKTGRTAAIRWAEQFIGLSIVNKTKDGKELKSKEFGNWKGADFIKDNFAEAKTVMYWEMEPADAFKGYDVNDLIRGALKSRALMKKKIADNKYTPEEQAKINIHISDDVVKLLAQAAAQDNALEVLPEVAQA